MRKPFPIWHYLLIVGVCLVMTTVSFGAQEKFGVKAGISVATQQSHFPQNWFGRTEVSERSGIAVAGVYEVLLGSSVWLRLEPMYVQKGAKVDWEGGAGAEIDLDHTHEMDYLVVPANLKVVVSHSRTSPFVFAGPYFGYVLSERVDWKAGQKVADVDQKEVDFGLEFGAGADVRLNGEWFLTVDARYSLGLLDISELDESSYKNRGVTFLAGVLLLW